MELTPQQKSAIEALYDVILRAIGDTDLSVELREMRCAGVQLSQIDITLLVDSAPGAPPPATAESDADFLHSLHIAPDLEVK